jgi:hypothetical protein
MHVEGGDAFGCGVKMQWVVTWEEWTREDKRSGDCILGMPKEGRIRLNAATEDERGYGGPSLEMDVSLLAQLDTI